MTQGLLLGELVEACYDLRAGGAAGDPEFWNAFVAETFRSLTEAYGALSEDIAVGDPLTIATFLEVKNVLALETLERDLVLNALTVWPERHLWQAAEGRPGPPIILSPRQAIGGRLIHAARRGRAVWFPDGFEAGSLSEMHRRLSFITLQTEMLTRFLVRTAERLPDLPPAWSDWSQPAARVIGLLYSGRLAATDSTSPGVQIEASGPEAVEAINKVRRHWPPLGDLQP
jgi:hypothetical protein